MSEVLITVSWAQCVRPESYQESYPYATGEKPNRTDCHSGIRLSLITDPVIDLTYGFLLDSSRQRAFAMASNGAQIGTAHI